jgi:hypothetical protein
MYHYMIIYSLYNNAASTGYPGAPTLANPGGARTSLAIRSFVSGSGEAGPPRERKIKEKAQPRDRTGVTGEGTRPRETRGEAHHRAPGDRSDFPAPAHGCACSLYRSNESLRGAVTKAHARTTGALTYLAIHLRALTAFFTRTRPEMATVRLIEKAHGREYIQPIKSIGDPTRRLKLDTPAHHEPGCFISRSSMRMRRPAQREVALSRMPAPCHSPLQPRM